MAFWVHVLYCVLIIAFAFWVFRDIRGRQRGEGSPLVATAVLIGIIVAGLILQQYVPPQVRDNDTVTPSANVSAVQTAAAQTVIAGLPKSTAAALTTAAPTSAPIATAATTAPTINGTTAPAVASTAVQQPTSTAVPARPGIPNVLKASNYTDACAKSGASAPAWQLVKSGDTIKLGCGSIPSEDNCSGATNTHVSQIDQPQTVNACELAIGDTKDGNGPKFSGNGAVHVVTMYSVKKTDVVFPFQGDIISGSSYAAYMNCTQKFNTDPGKTTCNVFLVK